MLRILTSFYGYSISATDGEIGCAHEFLFEDRTWEIKHLVVKMGNFLTGHRVLVPVGAIGRPELSTKSLPVNLTMEQVENRPGVQTERYSAPRKPGPGEDNNEWINAVLPGGGAPLPLIPLHLMIDEVEGKIPPAEGTNRSLLSTRDVVGCRLQASDEQIGHLEDFILDDEHWRIRYLVIGTNNRLAGRHILISPGWITGVSWDNSKVQINLRRESVEQSPEFDPAMPPDREYEVRLYDYYFGRPFNNDSPQPSRALSRLATVNDHR